MIGLKILIFKINQVIFCDSADAPAAYNSSMALTGKEVLQGVSLQDLEDIADQNPSFRGYMHGYIAEMFLKRHLEDLPGVSNVQKIPDSELRKGDFSLEYQGKTLTVEAKSLSSRRLRQDVLNDSWIGVVHLKKPGAGKIPDSTERTTCVMRGEFDVLAICTFSLTKKWEFVYLLNKYIPSSEMHKDRLVSTITLDVINTPKITPDALRAFEELVNA